MNSSLESIADRPSFSISRTVIRWRSRVGEEKRHPVQRLLLVARERARKQQDLLGSAAASRCVVTSELRYDVAAQLCEPAGRAQAARPAGTAGLGARYGSFGGSAHQ